MRKPMISRRTRSVACRRSATAKGHAQYRDLPSSIFSDGLSHWAGALNAPLIERP
jgi:hypothetical protein